MGYRDANSVSSGGGARRLSRRSLLGTGVAIAIASQFDSPDIAAQAKPTLEPSGLTAKSVYSFDATSNVLLYSQNPDERLAVGSLVKITTALVVVEAVKDLNEQVLIDKSDLVDISVYSNMQLIEGDTLTVSLLLYGLLVPSANDGANALARHVGAKLSGNEEPEAARAAFVDRMNAFAKEQGLKNTQYQNASGTDEQDTFSSARDVATLFSLLMKNEKLKEIAGLRSYQGVSSGPEKREYTDDSTDRLIGESGVIGGKTGTTEEAGACVTLAREISGGNIVITAILGADVEYDANSVIVPDSDKRWDDASAVISQMDEQFTWVAPPDDSATPGLEDEMNVWQVETKDQAPVPLRAGDDNSKYRLVLGAPVAAGEQAGAVDLFYGEFQLGSFPVYQAG